MVAKKLIVAVFPGVCETFASPLWSQSLLSSDYFPTLERPAKAISGSVDSGSWAEVPYDRSKAALLKLMPMFSPFCVGVSLPILASFVLVLSWGDANRRPIEVGGRT